MNNSINNLLSRRTGKRILAFLLAIAMVITGNVIPTAKTKVAQAAGTDSIKLGNPTWTDDSNYQFLKPTINVSSEQLIFCISVDNGGYFNLGAVPVGEVSGVVVTDEGTSYSNNVSASDNLESVTVIMTKNSGFDASDIESFIKSLTFNRNGVAEGTEQKVTICTSALELPDDMSVIALDGKLHYYRYVDWGQESSFDEYKNLSDTEKAKVTVTTRSSDSYNNPNTDLTWYTAYKNAKLIPFNGMQGYLATITTQFEHDFIYNSISDNLGTTAVGAWMGGARTKDTTYTGGEIGFDSDEITELNPGEKTYDYSTNSFADPVYTWKWVCGPEAGSTFYTLDELDPYGNSKYEGTANMFEYWNRLNRNGGDSNEPNNTSTTYAVDGLDTTAGVNQEYCLEYGFNSKTGAWNDWNPYYSVKNNYGNYAVSGYIIEYSPYTNNSGDTPKVIEEDTPSIDDSVIIKGREDKTSISAHDMIIQLDEITSGNIDDTNVDLALETGCDASSINANGDAVDSNITGGDDVVKVTEPDVVPVTFTNSTNSDYDTTVNVYVVDEVSAIMTTDNNYEIQIGANDFDISVDDASKTGDDLADIVKKLSGVVATAAGYDPSTVPTSEIVYEASKSTLEAKPGVYDVTFSYTLDGKTVEVTVKATVKQNGDYYDANDNDDNNTNTADESITSNNFVVEMDVSYNPPDREIKDLVLYNGDVTATDGDGTPIDVNNCTIPNSELQKLINAIHEGPVGTVVTVNVTTPDGNATTPVNVTIVDSAENNTHPSADDPSVTVYGNNITIFLNDYDDVFGTNYVNNLKDLTKAGAYVTDTKAEVEITNFDFTAVQKQVSSEGYDLIIKTADGDTATVKVFITDSDRELEITPEAKSDNTIPVGTNDTPKVVSTSAPDVDDTDPKAIVVTQTITVDNQTTTLQLNPDAIKGTIDETKTTISGPGTFKSGTDNTTGVVTGLTAHNSDDTNDTVVTYVVKSDNGETTTYIYTIVKQDPSDITYTDDPEDPDDPNADIEKTEDSTDDTDPSNIVKNYTITVPFETTDIDLNPAYENATLMGWDISGNSSVYFDKDDSGIIHELPVTDNGNETKVSYLLQGENGNTVTINYTIIREDTDPAIVSYDAIISLDDIKNGTISSNNIEDLLKHDCSVDATDNKNMEVGSTLVKEDGEKVVNVTEPDVVQVTFVNDYDDTVTSTSNVFIVDETKIDYTDTQQKIVIGANDFDISIDDASKTGDELSDIVKKLSDVVATFAGDEIITAPTRDIVYEADKSTLKAEPGVYDVTFSYTRDGKTVEVTVKATVKQNGDYYDANDNDDNNTNTADESITSNNFVVEMDPDYDDLLDDVKVLVFLSSLSLAS